MKLKTFRNLNILSLVACVFLQLIPFFLLSQIPGSTIENGSGNVDISRTTVSLALTWSFFSLSFFFLITYYVSQSLAFTYLKKFFNSRNFMGRLSLITLNIFILFFVNFVIYIVFSFTEINISTFLGVLIVLVIFNFFLFIFYIVFTIRLIFGVYQFLNDIDIELSPLWLDEEVNKVNVEEQKIKIKAEIAKLINVNEAIETSVKLADWFMPFSLGKKMSNRSKFIKKPWSVIQNTFYSFGNYHHLRHELRILKKNNKK